MLTLVVLVRQNTSRSQLSQRGSSPESIENPNRDTAIKNPSNPPGFNHFEFSNRDNRRPFLHLFSRRSAPPSIAPCTTLPPLLLPSDCPCDTISCHSHRSFQPGMSPSHKNSFATRAALKVGNDSFEIYRLDALESAGVGHVSRLPVLAESAARKSFAPRRRSIRSSG